jgi:Tol biopolymer transport system component
VLTFLSEGGIAEHVPGTATDRWLVSNPHIRGFGWSPDGNRLAYLTGSGTAASGCTVRIRTMASGETAVVGQWVSHAEPLADGCGSVADQVRWSPDGRFVAYTEQGHLFVADVSRRTARHVADVKGFGITWWPGGRIAYPCTYADAFGATDWCALRPDGSGRIALPLHGWDVTWSPQSGRVAYLLDPGRNSGTGRLQVWLTTPAGTDNHRLFAQPRECCFNLIPNLDWSPDGTRLIVTGAEANVVDAATGASSTLGWWSQVSEQAGLSGHPSWRP